MGTNARGCSSCGEVLGPTWYELEARFAAVDQADAQRVAGTALILGGSAKAVGIASALAGPVRVRRAPYGSVRLCARCFAEGVGGLFEGDDAEPEVDGPESRA